VKRAGEISLPFAAAKPCLARRVFASRDQAARKGPAESGCDQFGLIEPTQTLPRPVQRNGNDELSAKGLASKAFFQEIA